MPGPLKKDQRVHDATLGAPLAEAIAVENGSKGVQAAKAGQIDLVIMDVGLTDIDGREAVRILRKNGFKAPIIMLTGHDTDSDTILGLESGANDYVTKPFRSWRRLKGYGLLPKVILGVKFNDGVEVLRSQTQTAAALSRRHQDSAIAPRTCCKCTANVKTFGLPSPIYGVVRPLEAFPSEKEMTFKLSNYKTEHL
jgi:CheY-like chemotaxis protein